MSKKKITKEELDFVNSSLKEFKEQLERIMEYIKDNPWTVMSNDTKSDEFKFQTALFDKYNQWMKSYLELSGVYDFYIEAQNKEKDKTNVRQGTNENPIMQFLKSGEVEDVLNNLK